MAATPSLGNGNDIGFLAALIAGGSLVLQLVMNVGTFIWSLSRSKNATDEKIARKDKDLSADMAALERRMKDAVDQVIRDCGEMGQALRQKIAETDKKAYETELWTRDNLVSKPTFNIVTSDIRRTLDKLVDRVDERFDRLEDKLSERTPSK
jgi:hypothetical protein